MRSTLFFAASASAYTVINIQTPFMNKNIDPLVFPGQHGKSHMHSFYGSDAVTIDTKNSQTLQTGCTNAENPNDLSVYWVPSVMYTTDNRRTWKYLPVQEFKAYYSAIDGRAADITIPQNLNMIAGNAKGTKPSDVPAGARSSWFCPDENVPLDRNGFPSRRCAAIMQQILYFPECVNPNTLETAYKTDRRAPCPGAMKQIPQLRFSIRYDLRQALPNGWNGEAPLTLASGNAYSSHGDFMMGWPQDAANNLLRAVNQGRTFVGVDGSRGGAFQTPNCRPRDRDPNRGTSDYSQSASAMSANNKRTVWGSRLAKTVV